MTIAADQNEFPRVIFVEGAAPGTPPAGMIYVYAKADSLLYWKDDTGAEGGPIGGGGGVADLDDLGDVDLTGASDGDVLTLDTGVWVPQAPAGGGGAAHYSPWDVPTVPHASDIEGSAALSSNTNRQGASTTQGAGVIVTGEAASTAGHVTGTDWAGTMADGDTWTIGIRDGALFQDYAACGMYVADSTPAGVRSLTLVHDGNSVYPQAAVWTALTTQTSAANFQNPGLFHMATLPVFMRLLRNSATSYDWFISMGGRSWRLLQNFNPGFTVARVGIMAYSASNTIDVETAAGFLRKNWVWGD